MKDGAKNTFMGTALKGLITKVIKMYIFPLAINSLYLGKKIDAVYHTERIGYMHGQCYKPLYGVLASGTA